MIGLNSFNLGNRFRNLFAKVLSKFERVEVAARDTVCVLPKIRENLHVTTKRFATRAWFHICSAVGVFTDDAFVIGDLKVFVQQVGGNGILQTVVAHNVAKCRNSGAKLFKDRSGDVEVVQRLEHRRIVFEEQTWTIRVACHGEDSVVCLAG